MTGMTDTERTEQAQQVITYIIDQVQTASDAGGDRLHHLMWSVAYALGAMVPAVVEPRGMMPLMGDLIEAMTKGAEAGVEAAKLPGTFQVIRRSL